MKKNLTARTVFIVLVLLICVFGVIGFPGSVAALKRNVAENIRLGLDLRGGSYLVAEVQVQDALRAEALQVIERLKEDFRKQNITYAEMTASNPQAVEQANAIQVDVKGVPAGQSNAVRTIISDKYADWMVTATSSNDYYLRMKPSVAQDLKKNTVERSIQTISNRINALGVSEPTVQAYGSSSEKYQILIQLPGVDDPQHVKDMIGTTARLEITDVKDGPFASREAALAQHGGVLPINTKLVKDRPRANSQGEEWYLVSSIPVLSGQQMRNARPQQGDLRKWETAFTLSPDGGKRFATFTEANIGNRLAVVLDNQIVSVATIQARIEDSGVITGLSSQQEATDLSNFLKSGSLPAGVKYLEEHSIGPSLGADSIHAGIVAGIAGLLAVIVVMLLYYKRAGVNAVLALILNTVVLMAALSYFGAVLTLPGIAGVILTIGMAVDSNVLIFERIREELRAGKAVVAAVDAGFSKAWWTIVDTHVTTVVSCAFLFLFGEGPVRGFAVTLVIGLVANLFTAVFVSRTIFEYELGGRRQMSELSI
ncbi:MAG: protein translocase subunit SecD [Acidobacteriia bacterium]|nr:protein translocase subunit SecD [Terriglobia bacterium]